MHKYIIMGVQGSGKGTLAKLLASEAAKFGKIVQQANIRIEN